MSFGCLYFCFCSPPDYNCAVGYLVQVGLFYVVNDYLVVLTVSVGFMQLENFMVSQAVQGSVGFFNFGMSEVLL